MAGARRLILECLDEPRRLVLSENTPFAYLSAWERARKMRLDELDEAGALVFFDFQPPSGAALRRQCELRRIRDDRETDRGAFIRERPVIGVGAGVLLGLDAEVDVKPGEKAPLEIRCRIVGHKVGVKFTLVAGKEE